MAAVSKRFIVFFLWVFVSAAAAEESAMLINPQQEDEIINLAYTQMQGSFEALENKIEQCRILAKNNTLPPTLFKSLPLTEQEMRVILGHFKSLTQEKCEDMGLWAKLAMEFAQFKHIEKYYKGKNTIETAVNFETICCISSEGRFEEKWNYLKIAPEIREKLERIPELQQPFDFIKTAEIMGLF